MANRPTIMGTRHVIAAGHYLAAHAGFQILEGGGNAVDAGVAAGIAMGVLQTDKVSFGGVAPLIVYLAKKKEIHCIDGLGVWPKMITPDFFQKFHGGKIPANELRSVVPAAPDSWITALERFGTMTFGEVASAAIRFAGEGFPMYPLMSEFITANQSSYERYPANKKIFLPKGKPPVPGELFVQADLGRTLQYMADVEKANKRKGRKLALRAARDAFYKGDIAAAIVKHHKKVGGLMRMEDFAEFSVKFEPVPADEHADLRVARLPRAEPEVAGCEVKFLVEERIVRDVHLPVDAQQRTVRVNDRGGVVVEAGGAFLKERRDDDDLVLARQLAERGGAGAGDGLGEFEVRVVLALAEVLRAEKFLRADDLRASLRATLHLRERLAEIRGRIRGATGLNQTERDGRTGAGTLHGR